MPECCLTGSIRSNPSQPRAPSPSLSLSLSLQRPPNLLAGHRTHPRRLPGAPSGHRTPDGARGRLLGQAARRRSDLAARYPDPHPDPGPHPESGALTTEPRSPTSDLTPQTPDTRSTPSHSPKPPGAGLTYGTTVSNSSESRMLSFGLYRCADALGAYKAAKQILVDYAKGDLVISDVQVCTAHSLAQPRPASPPCSRTQPDAGLQPTAPRRQRRLAANGASPLTPPCRSAARAPSHTRFLFVSLSLTHARTPGRPPARTHMLTRLGTPCTRAAGGRQVIARLQRHQPHRQQGFGVLRRVDLRLPRRRRRP